MRLRPRSRVPFLKLAPPPPRSTAAGGAHGAAAAALLILSLCGAAGSTPSTLAAVSPTASVVLFQGPLTQGDTGGVTGADALCAAALPGALASPGFPAASCARVQAFLSSNGTNMDVKSRIPDAGYASRPVFGPTHKLISTTWTGLFSSTPLYESLARADLGLDTSGIDAFWTGTTSYNGGYASGAACVGPTGAAWTTNSSLVGGIFGTETDYDDPAFSYAYFYAGAPVHEYQSGSPCSDTKRLVCSCFVDPPKSTASPTQPSNAVLGVTLFYLEGTRNGNLGGQDGADALCVTRRVAAQAEGRFPTDCSAGVKAFLAGTNRSLPEAVPPAHRFSPVYGFNGTLLSKSWWSLFTSRTPRFETRPLNALPLTSTTRRVWTGYDPLNPNATSSDCTAPGDTRAWTDWGSVNGNVFRLVHIDFQDQLGFGPNSCGTEFWVLCACAGVVTTPSPTTMPTTATNASTTTSSPTSPAESVRLDAVAVLAAMTVAAHVVVGLGL